MTDPRESFAAFVRDKLAPAGLAHEFIAQMLSLARVQATGVGATLDTRLRDTLYGSIDICFRIADIAEEALKPSDGKPTPDAGGGFL